MRITKEYLEGLDPSLEIGDVLKKIKEKEKSDDEKLKNERESFEKDLIGKFIKIKDDGLFISDMFIKVDDISFESFTVDYKDYYKMVGDIYSVSYEVGQIFKSPNKNVTRQGFEYKEISEADFNKVGDVYKLIKSKIDEIKEKE